MNMKQASPDRWLSIREASQTLGVHIGTVREWADHGRLASYRTPGGHRRFRNADLQRFLSLQHTPDTTTPDERVLRRVRADLQTSSHQEQAASAEYGGHPREIGRQLLACVTRFAQEPELRNSLLTEGRAIAQTYGQALAEGGLSAGNAARAALRYRRIVLPAVLSETLGSRTGDEEDAQFFQRISDFLDEILLAILDVYP
ncbi:MAG: helix-turn-helix domain-containing protein [Chloroflexi bacterium]|nr:helix-turn-helix domain-containing protein [Chloroflexota bacterium]